MKKYQVGKVRPCYGGKIFVSLKEGLLWKAF
jgi:hypothetical protein